MSKDVHTEHCCRIHGCKYASVDCTVMNGVEQSYPCEQCSDSTKIKVAIGTLNFDTLVKEHGAVRDVCLMFADEGIVWVKPG